MYSICYVLGESACESLLEPPCACAYWLLNIYLQPLPEKASREDDHIYPLSLLTSICENVIPLPPEFLSM